MVVSFVLSRYISPVCDCNDECVMRCCGIKLNKTTLYALCFASRFQNSIKYPVNAFDVWLRICEFEYISANFAFLILILLSLKCSPVYTCKVCAFLEQCLLKKFWRKSTLKCYSMLQTSRSCLSLNVKYARDLIKSIHSPDSSFFRKSRFPGAIAVDCALTLLWNFSHCHLESKETKSRCLKASQAAVQSRLPTL